jgi:uncharacterized protein
MNVKCPVCKKEFIYKESKFRPFCQERCKQVDLGHWLTESYTVKSEENLSEEDINKIEEELNKKMMESEND